MLNAPTGDNDYGPALRAGPDRACAGRHPWTSVVRSWAIPVLTISDVNVVTEPVGQHPTKVAAGVWLAGAGSSSSRLGVRWENLQQGWESLALVIRGVQVTFHYLQLSP